nr:phage tail protein [Pseudomonas sp. S11A4]
MRVSPTDENVLIAELVLPPDVGGWWIRELALEGKDGVFSAVANVAPSYKPLLAQGSGRNQVVRMHIITSGVRHSVEDRPVGSVGNQKVRRRLNQDALQQGRNRSHDRRGFRSTGRHNGCVSGEQDPAWVSGVGRQPQEHCCLSKSGRIPWYSLQPR